jgi:hypothetical protein
VRLRNPKFQRNRRRGHAPAIGAYRINDDPLSSSASSADSTAAAAPSAVHPLMEQTFENARSIVAANRSENVEPAAARPPTALHKDELESTADDSRRLTRGDNRVVLAISTLLFDLSLMTPLPNADRIGLREICDESTAADATRLPLVIEFRSNSAWGVSAARDCARRGVFHRRLES